MASSEKNLSLYNMDEMPDGKDLSIGIVVSDWNHEITFALYQGAMETLEMHGVSEDNIRTVQVPGSFELPAAAKLLLANQKYDAIICLGCVIKGETKHDEYINQSVALALQQLAILSNVPCVFGVLTPNTVEQAKARAGGEHGNKGVEAAQTALRMANLKKTLRSTEKKGIGF